MRADAGGEGVIAMLSLAFLYALYGTCLGLVMAVTFARRGQMSAKKGALLTLMPIMWAPVMVLAFWIRLFKPELLAAKG